MDDADLRAVVVEELARHAEGGVFSGRDITAATRLESLGINSMAALSAISSLEERLKPAYPAGFRVSLPQTVGDVVDLMAAHCPAGPVPGTR